MGDYSRLVKDISGDPAVEYSTDDVILSGKYAIPFFWTTIFLPRHLRERETETDLYDVLMVSSEEAVELAGARKERFIKLFASPLEDMYSEWTKILLGLGKCHLMMDIDDLRGTSMEPNLDEKLPLWAGALEEKNAGGLQFALQHGMLGWNEKSGKAEFVNSRMKKDEMTYLLIGG